MSRKARADIEHIDGIHKTLVDQKKKGFAEAVEQDRKEAAAWLDHAQGKMTMPLRPCARLPKGRNHRGTNLMAEYLPRDARGYACSR